MPKDVVAFTVRLPRHLEEQVSARAEVNHRNRNQEIVALVEYALDEKSRQDLMLLKGSGGRKADAP